MTRVCCATYVCAPTTLALCAQVPPSSDMIVGSVMTTAGLKKALLGMGRDRFHVEVFYPFAYTSGFFEGWDVVLIEGWFLSINTFIHEVHQKRCGGGGAEPYSAAALSLPQHLPPAHLPLQVRRVSPPDPARPIRAHGPVVLFWCLDPAFPGAPPPTSS